MLKNGIGMGVLAAAAGLAQAQDVAIVSAAGVAQAATVETGTAI